MKVSRKVIFAAILVFAVAVRLYFALGTERALNMDECLVGIMVKQVAEGETYYRTPGVDFGGRNVIIAYTLALPAGIFGVSDLLVTSFMAVSSLLLLVAFTLLVRAVFGTPAGLLSGVLLAFSSHFTKASFQTYGYTETLFFTVMAALLLFVVVQDPAETGGGRARSPDGRPFLFALMGVFAGLALWSSEFTIIFLLPMALVALYHIRKFGFWGALIGLSGFCVGWSVKLRFLVHMESENRTFSRWLDFHGLPEYFSRVASIAVEKFPWAFSPYIFRYHERLPLYAAVSCAVFWLFWAYLVFRLVAGKERGGRWALLAAAAGPGYYFLLLALFQFGLRNPRYFQPMTLIIAVVMGVAAVKMYGGGRVGRWAAPALVCLFLAAQAVGIADMARCRYGSCTDAGTYRELIDFLDEHDISGIYTNYSTKWLVAFYSGERIIGSDIYFNQMPRYMPYEEEIASMEKVPYVFPPGTEYMPLVERYLEKNAVRYRKTKLRGFTIIYDLSESLSPLGWSRGYRTPAASEPGGNDARPADEEPGVKNP